MASDGPLKAEQGTRTSELTRRLYICFAGMLGIHEAHWSNDMD